MSTPLERLRHHVTGAIERGEKTAITEKRAPIITAHYIDCCLPDYFLGQYPNDRLFTMPVWKGMTWRDVFMESRDALQHCDALTDVINDADAHKALCVLFNGMRGLASLDCGPAFANNAPGDPHNDDCETVYLYIGFEVQP